MSPGDGMGICKALGENLDPSFVGRFDGKGM
jgi:hypothetical protein